ncbi:tRNA (5-methylaminomethyl-2-thiouridine)(34)-methyltransferase MnmD [Mesonia ostreae]|uniref:tRNA (5-methylaminomethyl-2-thiouridine)(34)-methyltransferase MnmD n=1 Tax=Mesonia ostreae TaxID=861110 RepID=A0ABU2KED0_9FLAO|nr:tRNA (5-methylaminomethyl-2-thiouridine)(34)-methyltransferase MnmD [Mesonia ostreae]MDT0293059.1 tRNA (5-methylaminomethyl-2-thiouridine)(34)-methyltransferase MnmD [Mesonia ostreae]
MKREIMTTADGSTTIHIPEWNEQYHSKHGAIQEAYHVFIKTGFNHFPKEISPIKILEIGFGTGLNALITSLEAKNQDRNVEYCGVEGYPVSLQEMSQLNYATALDHASAEVYFQNIHEGDWEENFEVHDQFQLIKQEKMFDEIENRNEFDLIYFDAFGARVQPELWDVAMFQKMYEALKENGILVTYSAKGSVRRALQEVGYTVERLEGPPGKREMLRATKGNL